MIKKLEARIERIKLWIRVAEATGQYDRALKGIFREIRLQGKAI